MMKIRQDFGGSRSGFVWCQIRGSRGSVFSTSCGLKKPCLCLRPFIRFIRGFNSIYDKHRGFMWTSELVVRGHNTTVIQWVSCAKLQRPTRRRKNTGIPGRYLCVCVCLCTLEVFWAKQIGKNEILFKLYDINDKTAWILDKWNPIQTWYPIQPNE